MSKTKKLKEQILRLLSEEHEVSIRSIARSAGLSENNDTDRKTIRRSIQSLQDQSLLGAKGAGRSRVYVAAIQPSETARVPVGYNQNFLRSYQHN